MMARERKPKMPHSPLDHRIPNGTARAALVASSLIWTQESNAPIVHIGESQASMNAHPLGQVVWSSNCPKTYEPEFIVPPLSTLPIGSAMTVAMTRPTFITMHMDWILGMTLAKNVAISP